MRVGMYYSNNDVRLEEMPKPKIEAGEFLFKVKASGICGSDVMEWYRIKKAPLVLGHEATGEITEIGQGLKKYKVGDRVFVAHHVPCNSCRYCVAGNHTACQMLHTTNYFPGGFAEYIRVPAINVERGSLLLPDEVSFEQGTFIEPLACVLRAQRAVQVKTTDTVLVLGSGISGLLHLLLAKASGAGRVIMTDINEFRLKKAKELGADFVFDAKEDIVASLRRVNENRLADVVVICASAASCFNQAINTVERAGTILCFAPASPGVTFNIPVNDFWRKNIKIIHSYGSSPSDNAVALELLQAKKVDAKTLITYWFPLAKIGEGFRLMVESKESIKIIIQP